MSRSTHRPVPTRDAHALLVSPAPLDGYPPVQYQAILLARAGFAVHILTSTLGPAGERAPTFPAASVLRLPMSPRSPAARKLAKVRFLLELARLRARLPTSRTVEISYDPEGVFYSEVCPGRSSFWIAHMHEMLIDPSNRFYEQRALRSLPQCDLVVVADERRAEILQRQVGLPRAPLSVPNYPLLDTTGSEGPVARDSRGPLRVAYHGAIGTTQCLDVVIRSVQSWPANASLHLFGERDRPSALELRRLARELGVEHRVRFEGWVPLPAMVDTLRSCHVGLSLLRPSHDNNRYALGASNKRYQYMQAGLPQISDTNPGVRELVESRGVGLCVEFDAPADIARAVEHYWVDESARRAAGALARRAYELELHYDRAFAHVLERIPSR